MSAAWAGGAEVHLGPHGEGVERQLADWEADRFVERLWSGDHRLWSPEPAAELTDRLGWLHLPATAGAGIEDHAELGRAVAAEGIDDILLCGMGGSSLAPEVFQRVLGSAEGRATLTVLDSTHPDAVASVARAIDPARTFCVVSSKSGGTIETLSLFRFFWSLIEANVEAPGSRFAAITDPGSSLEALGRERGFRAVVAAPSDVGGRYSALSPFGLVPAALIGVDTPELIDSARRMATACEQSAGNPGAELGAILGRLALAGRDKLTFVTGDRLAALPDWIEQLVAESTGKDGKGIVPVAGEPMAEASSYGADRVFVGLSVAGEDDGNLRDFLAEVGECGHPWMRLQLDSPLELGAEMFRWEFATAAASSVMGVHPFNQENVQLAKSLAKSAMSGDGEAVGDAPEEVRAPSPGLAGAVVSWLASAVAGDYLGVQAYLPGDPPVARKLRELQARLARRSGLAVTSGFGPRFLHSTGQLHKGGANNGVFLQLVNEPETDLRIPETDYTFGKLVAAQADGDAGALLQTGRRLLRLRMGSNPLEGLDALLDVIGA